MKSSGFSWFPYFFSQIFLGIGIFLFIGGSFLGLFSATTFADSTLVGTTGSQPRGIVTDGSGNIYVTNYGDNTVTKITPDGVSSVLGVTGSKPVAIGVDGSGNIYTADTDLMCYAGWQPQLDWSKSCYGQVYYTVTKITPEGVSSTFYLDWAYTNTNMTIDGSGNIYTVGTNGGTNQIRKITPWGSVSLFATISGSSKSIVADNSGNIYVLFQQDGSWYAPTIMKITPAGVSSVFFTAGTDDSAYALVIDKDDNLYTELSEWWNIRIMLIAPGGGSSTFATLWHIDYSSSTLAIDKNTGNIYAFVGNDIVKITAEWAVSPLSEKDGYSWFFLINVDAEWNVYTVNTDANTVSKVTQDITPPVIMLNGDNPQEVVQNTDYYDNSAICQDNVNPGVDRPLVVSGWTDWMGNIDTSMTGSYVVYYSCTDGWWNVATENRTVNVVPAPVVPPSTPIDISLSLSLLNTWSVSSGSMATFHSVIKNESNTDLPSNTSFEFYYLFSNNFDFWVLQLADGVFDPISVSGVAIPCYLYSKHPWDLPDPYWTLFNYPGYQLVACWGNLPVDILAGWNISFDFDASVTSNFTSGAIMAYGIVFVDGSDPDNLTIQSKAISWNPLFDLDINNIDRIRYLSPTSGSWTSSGTTWGWGVVASSWPGWSAGGVSHVPSTIPHVSGNTLPQGGLSLGSNSRVSLVPPIFKQAFWKEHMTFADDSHSVVLPLTDKICVNPAKLSSLTQLQDTSLPNNEFHDAVQKLIMYGIADNTENFRGSDSVTRWEYVTMLVRALSCYDDMRSDSGKSVSFSDVLSSLSTAKYIQTWVERGWINGYDDHTFRPDAPISRWEAAKILVRAIGLPDKIWTQKTQSNGQFSDVSEGNEFFPYISALRDLSVLDGKSDNRFAPSDLISRQEVAKIFANVFLKMVP